MSLLGDTGKEVVHHNWEVWYLLKGKNAFLEG